MPCARHWPLRCRAKESLRSPVFDDNRTGRSCAGLFGRCWRVTPMAGGALVAAAGPQQVPAITVRGLQDRGQPLAADQCGHRSVGRCRDPAQPLAPGAILTPPLEGPTRGIRARAARVRSFPRADRWLRRRRPSGRLDLASVLSDSADFLCGSVVFVDGGSDAFFRPRIGRSPCRYGVCRSTCGGSRAASGMGETGQAPLTALPSAGPPTAAGRGGRGRRSHC